MRSLEDRFGDVIEQLEGLGERPTLAQVDELHHMIDDLDYELQTTTGLGARRYELTKRSRHSHALLGEARNRALDITDEWEVPQTIDRPY
ncbi:hypothetical protein [Nocardia bhagyanarayanae]|uniref:Uncharacterized protein n=1 Tax=Nocardia bhagyanarayanae TaxID=1215925 RepID=A0A543EW04_9NOCA|nr:hypothetical protein [Nocardia bhagyanarayanae]TQM25780.1 hypothetical protein FB390_5945 [Nocardia bhagyanarayanae]